MAFNDVITFSDVKLNDRVRHVHYNQCIFLDFYLTRDRITLGRIRISIPRLNPGFPYLVCKNNVLYNVTLTQYYAMAYIQHRIDVDVTFYTYKVTLSVLIDVNANCINVVYLLGILILAYTQHERQKLINCVHVLVYQTSRTAHSSVISHAAASQLIF